MARYFTIEPDKGFLLNFQGLATSSDQGGVTQTEIDRAMDYAEREINAKLGRQYSVTPWATTCPPIVSQIADLLGSYYAWVFKFGAEGQSPTPDLKDRAHDLMDQIIVGKMEILDASGNVVSRTWKAIPGSIE